MTPTEVLNFILEKENLNPNRLSKMLGYERSQAIYDIKKGKAKSISTDFANRVIKNFPNSGYTLAFLLTGDKKLLEMKDEFCETRPVASLSPPPNDDFVPDRSEMETKDNIIRRQESQIDFLKEVISIKEREIVDKNFAINELTKKIKILESELTNRNLVQKKGKTA